MSRIAARYAQVRDWLYGGDRDTEVSHEAWKPVKIRYSQVCCSGYHLNDAAGKSRGVYQPGTLMVCETALVDGRWGSCYTCGYCIRAAENELRTGR
jgi:hypothetical protein